MNKQFFTSNGGYTLVEVLVAIMIVTLMLTIGVASYREFSTRQALQSVGRQIIGDLRLTQEEALAGKKPVGACQVLDGYRFIISGSSYSVVANCDGSLASVSVGKDNISLSAGYTATDANILFRVLGRGTDLTSDQAITLRQGATAKTLSVVVTMAGEIKLGSAATSTPVPTPTPTPASCGSYNAPCGGSRPACCSPYTCRSGRCRN